MAISHAEAKADPERYKILSNGAVYDLQQGRIAGNPGGGTTAITQARSSELRSLWNEKKQKARLRGLARAVGIDPDEIEVTDGAADAAEQLTEHMARTFLQSKNLRGMGETWTKLLGMDENNGETTAARGNTSVVAIIMREIAGNADDAGVIDAEVSDEEV